MAWCRRLHTFRSRRSSEVEHTLGKGGVECSIHSGGTIGIKYLAEFSYLCTLALPQIFPMFLAGALQSRQPIQSTFYLRIRDWSPRSQYVLRLVEYFGPDKLLNDVEQTEAMAR
jgi:hypothetical protein